MNEDALVETLTGDCEIDCQEACAYPGEFSECELVVPVGEGTDDE